jgi:hypothetical protein
MAKSKTDIEKGKKQVKDRHTAKRWSVYLPGKYQQAYQELSEESRRTLAGELSLALDHWLIHCGKKIPE